MTKTATFFQFEKELARIIKRLKPSATAPAAIKFTVRLRNGMEVLTWKPGK